MVLHFIADFILLTKNGWSIDHSPWEVFKYVLSHLLRDAHSSELRAWVIELATAEVFIPTVPVTP